LGSDGKEAAKLLGTGLMTLGRKNIETMARINSPKNEYLKIAAVAPPKTAKPNIAAMNERLIERRKRYFIMVHSGARGALK
jgi:hypothetical protein